MDIPRRVQTDTRLSHLHPVRQLASTHPGLVVGDPGPSAFLTVSYLFDVSASALLDSCGGCSNSGICWYHASGCCVTGSAQFLRRAWTSPRSSTSPRNRGASRLGQRCLRCLFCSTIACTLSEIIVALVFSRQVPCSLPSCHPACLGSLCIGIWVAW